MVDLRPLKSSCPRMSCTSNLTKNPLFLVNVALNKSPAEVQIKAVSVKSAAYSKGQSVAYSKGHGYKQARGSSTNGVLCELLGRRWFNLIHSHKSSTHLADVPICHSGASERSKTQRAIQYLSLTWKCRTKRCCGSACLFGSVKSPRCA